MSIGDNVNLPHGDNISLNIAIYRLNEQGFIPRNASPIGKDCDVVLVSNDGVYSGNMQGVSLPIGRFKGGTDYGVVISTFEPTNVAYKLVLYSSEKVKIRRI